MSLKKNAIWNLLGAGGPLVAALFSIPYLLHTLGNEAFGVLTLIWALIGYFSLFDFGVGRALAYEVSKRAQLLTEEIAPHIRAGVALTLLTGIVGAVLVMVLSKPLASHWLNIKNNWQQDALLSFLIASLGIVPTTLSSGLRGALEGLNRFFDSNVNRLLLGILMFLLPVWSIYMHGNHLWIITLYMVAARYFSVSILVFQLRRFIFLKGKLNKDHLAALFNYGFWITVTGIIGPLMVYGDRFFVSATVGADLLPQYAIPQEGLQRLLIIPTAICGALFPRLSMLSLNEVRQEYRHRLKQVTLLMFGVSFLSVALAYPLLSIWISPSFAINALPIVAILAIGIWVNSMTMVPYTVMHALGKPKITAIYHAVEMALYIGLIWSLTARLGVLGAALAWTLRVVIDLVLLLISVHKVIHVK